MGGVTKTWNIPWGAGPKIDGNRQSECGLSWQSASWNLVLSVQDTVSQLAAEEGKSVVFGLYEIEVSTVRRTGHVTLIGGGTSDGQNSASARAQVQNGRNSWVKFFSCFVKSVVVAIFVKVDFDVGSAHAGKPPFDSANRLEKLRWKMPREMQHGLFHLVGWLGAKWVPKRCLVACAQPFLAQRINRVLERAVLRHGERLIDDDHQGRTHAKKKLLPEQAPFVRTISHMERPLRFEAEVRVIYGDTDKMGVVYYANYFRYFEYSRSELFRACGGSYVALEEAGFDCPW